MDMPDNAWLAAGTILAALIAGLISFVNLLIAKDQKTTDLRQVWIDSVRETVSQFTAHAVKAIPARNMARVVTEESHSGFEARERAATKMLTFFEDQQRPSLELRNKILLHLNPIEHAKLIRGVRELHEKTQLRSVADLEMTEALADDVLEKTQQVLKYEWRRVKRGEAVYRVMKSVLATLVAVLFVGIVYGVIRILHVGLP